MLLLAVRNWPNAGTGQEALIPRAAGDTLSRAPNPPPPDSCSATDVHHQLPATVCKHAQAWPSQMAQAAIAAAPAEKAHGVVDTMSLKLQIDVSITQHINVISYRPHRACPHLLACACFLLAKFRESLVRTSLDPLLQRARLKEPPSIFTGHWCARGRFDAWTQAFKSGLSTKRALAANFSN